jgi:hypothetical protein
LYISGLDSWSTIYEAQSNNRRWHYRCCPRVISNPMDLAVNIPSWIINIPQPWLTRSRCCFSSLFHPGSGLLRYALRERSDNVIRRAIFHRFWQSIRYANHVFCRYPYPGVQTWPFANKKRLDIRRYAFAI